MPHKINPLTGKQLRGFASMNKEVARSISSRGGKKAWMVGGAHKFTHEEAVAAGKLSKRKQQRDKENV